MKDQKKVSRRQLFGLLTGLFAIPAIAKDQDVKTSSEDDEEYETLLKSDGSTVRISKNNLSKANIIKKEVSNSSMLNWLKNQNR